MECMKCKESIPEEALFCPYCGKKQVSNTRKQSRRGNGTGSVYRRGSGWAVEVTKGYKLVDGKPKRIIDRKAGFKTKKEAMEYIPVLQGRQKREKNITWNALYELWLPTHRAGKSTIDCYKAASKHFSPIEFYQLKDIEIDDLQECLDECPNGKRTRENMKALCGLMYKYAIPRGYADLNFALYLIVSGEGGVSRESFTAEQLEKIKNAVSTIPYADYIYCMCYLGFRISEFLSLEVKDYDPILKKLTGGSKTSAGKNRIVTISPKIQNIIDQIIGDRTSGTIFCNKDGNPFSYTTFRDTAFYPALEQIGIDNPVENNKHKYTTHTCRHTFATLMKAIQAPEKDKMELIGHASPEMLRYYQDVNLNDLRKITDLL